MVYLALTYLELDREASLDYSAVSLVYSDTGDFVFLGVDFDLVRHG